MLNVRRFIYPALILLLLISLGFTVYFMARALQSNSNLSPSTHFEKPRYHFILVPEEMDNPYWHRVEKGAKAAAAKHHAVVEYSGPGQTDPDEHTQVLEMAVASKVDGIITQGLSKKTTPVINKASQQGIPVITVDTDVPNSRRVAYIGTNNYEAGKRAGRTLIHATHGNAKVGIVTGSFQTNGQKQRVKGFRDAVKHTSGIHIVAIEASHISRVQAAEKAYDIFKKHPDVTALFGTSALDGLGISATAQSLGKTDDVYILAFDKLPETIKLIKKGVIDATVAQNPYEMGYKSVETMVKVVNGKNVSKIPPVPTKVIDASDLPRFKPSNRRGVTQ